MGGSTRARKHLATYLVLAAVDCLALATWATSVSPGALAAPVATTAGQKTYAKFGFGRQYKPGTFRFGMSGFVTDMSWFKWGKKLARGQGTYQYNDCIPYCAAGTIHPTPASVILTGRERCGGRFLFSHFKIYYAGRRTGGPTYCK
jgi:hypothetical protein